MIVPRPRQEILPRPIELEKLLLVEGPTPAHFFEALATHLGIAHLIEIRDYYSISQLSDHLRILATTTEFRTRVKSLGIARDAETNPQGAVHSVQSAIASAKIDSSVKTSFQILPDDHTPGMLETLCIRSIADAPVHECIATYIDCARANGSVFHPDGRLDKNRAQVYLASHQDAQLYPGIAASRGHWPFDHEAFAEVRDFLTNL